MPKLIGKFLKTQLIPLIIVFGFALSNLGYGSISVWAQESSQNNNPQTMQNANQPTYGTHPCFSQYGNQTARVNHFSQYGNYTARANHFGQYGNQTVRANHFGQHGSLNGNRLNPCFNQKTNPTSSGNNTVTQSGITIYNKSVLQYQIPSWIKNNAKWWSQNKVNDTDFVSGIQYLIQQGDMKIPTTSITQSSSSSKQIPSWIKTNAAWWASGQISDDDFVKGIQYLVSSGIMKV